MAVTYNGFNKDGTPTYGGYSSAIVVDKSYVLRIPKALQNDLAAAAPLLCAGITVYSPLRYVGVTKGMTVGVVGLGGLGHMAIKFAKAFGCKVVVFSTSASKRDEAVSKLGVDDFVISRDTAAMDAAAGTVDVMVDTVSAKHEVVPLIKALRTDGKLIVVGAPPEPFAVSSFDLLMKRISIVGSLIGGIKETQEMLDFCGAHNVVSDVEVVPIQSVNDVMVRLVNADVKYRFVLDIANTLA